MPQLVTARYRRADGRTRRLYVPVVPVLLVLSPLVLLAVVAAFVAARAFGMGPRSVLGALGGVGRLLWALPGARFDMQQGRTAVLIKVS
ncbi:hypothetical protein ACH41E_19690 [Streptomyces sp. NPDC020412]|uniref:hypothetical protein n=1 Tax=Streptomyces sp. NPDC020412 TaxID=3365073 RepID=UPI003795855F